MGLRKVERGPETSSRIMKMASAVVSLPFSPRIARDLTVEMVDLEIRLFSDLGWSVDGY